jgi:hypothetical protein
MAEHDLFATTWVHVFEEDGPDGAVYRPEGAPVRLSRRPRERISLSPDGSARLVVGGPDDRLQEVEGSWREDAGEIAVTTEAGAAPARTLRARLRSREILIVKR